MNNLQSSFITSFSNYFLSMDAKTWVNDALMTIFFIPAGLEIKRELYYRRTIISGIFGALWLFKTKSKDNR